ncbi:hypothetical protein [Paenibacillus sp. NEAU-GSW1]|uniref:hypothetical protein n=1 Tax=Paenibacillus sp. NEAU-GSW1 TaxID=2682486 RepID=UPI0012E1437B|nr:hypothetical protein [Paenibacillus sp. NEAU-GSW1]MUT66006.1 hypothetical protein [Paenibacillus sp. NEAU-GSW1]
MPNEIEQTSGGIKIRKVKSALEQKAESSDQLERIEAKLDVIIKHFDIKIE